MKNNNTLTPIPKNIISQCVKLAFAEDLGQAGDITTASVVPEDATASARIIARQHGILAGIDIAKAAFETIDSRIIFDRHIDDGELLEPGRVVAGISGPARGILIAERTALNFLGHLCGIATQTGKFVETVKGIKAHICCTRKTTPGLRAMEKYAVRAGGGMNHRFGLDDAVLIKDNHIAVAGGIKPALQAARAATGHMIKIEIEVDTLKQLGEVLKIGADAILLDNMPPDVLAQAVKMIAGQAISEASGGVNLATVKAIAEAGVDLISIGAITHSAPTLDLGLDFDD